MVTRADTTIIETGTYIFFCQACLADKPASEQSPDSRYCQGCYEVIMAEKRDGTEVKANRDYWTRNDTVFVHYAKAYITGPDLHSYCLGPVEEALRKLDQAEKDASAAPRILRQTPSAAEKCVSKLADKGIIPPTNIQAQEKGVLKHPGGRPRKKTGEEVSRVTAWRRGKEMAEQGVLI